MVAAEAVPLEATTAASEATGGDGGTGGEASEAASGECMGAGGEEWVVGVGMAAAGDCWASEAAGAGDWTGEDGEEWAVDVPAGAGSGAAVNKATAASATNCATAKASTINSLRLLDMPCSASLRDGRCASASWRSPQSGGGRRACMWQTRCGGII